MPVRVKQAGCIALVFPEGELRQDATQPLIDAVTALLSGDTRVIVISMREVTALLSEGIRALVMLRDRVAAAEREFRLTDLSADVRYTLQVTNLLEFLHHVKTADAVLEEHQVRPGDVVDVDASGAAPAEEEQDGTAEATAGGREDEPAAPSSPAALQALIDERVPGRLPLEIVETLQASGRSSLDVQSMSDKLGANTDAVHAACERLAESGVLEKGKDDRYTYAPPSDVHVQIEELVRRWHNPELQSKILGMLLAAER